MLTNKIVRSGLRNMTRSNEQSRAWCGDMPIAALRRGCSGYARTARISEANGREGVGGGPDFRSKGHLGVGYDDGGEVGGMQVALRRRKDLPRRHRLDGGLVLEQVVLHTARQAS